MGSHNELSNKIQLCHDQTLSYMKEMREGINQLKKNNRVFSYFTYDLNLSHEWGQESSCLSSFHIRNYGRFTLHQPVICIKVSENAPFDFPEQVAEGWTLLSQQTGTGEFWLRPGNQSMIKSGETLTFPDFQIKWQADSSYAGSLTGFFYADECAEGIAALNAVSLNGNVRGKEDGHE